MRASHEEIVAIEKAVETLAAALNKGDVSSLSGMIADSSVIIPPAHSIVKGQGVLDAWRNMVTRNEGFQLHSSELEKLGEDVIRGVGTLSLRRKQQPEERVNYRYVMLWQKSDAAWKLDTMIWNRGMGSGGGKGGGQGASA